MDDQTRSFLAYLHQRGKMGYWWYASEARDEKRIPLEKTTVWWPVGRMVKLPPDSGPHGPRHLYFGVHPTTGLPQERTIKKTGEVYKPRPAKSRPILEEIAVINCLFAEFDAKRFDGGKMETLAHIDNLELPPSALIDSGGGYHAYWLLEEPFVLADDAGREYARRLQAGWVILVGSDDDAKDLSRVLRIPGTYNYKEAYGPNYPQVTWVRCDLDLRYPITDLETATRPFLTEGRESKPLDTSREPLSEYERVEEALSRIGADRWVSYRGWIDIGMALHSWDSGHNGLSLWDRYSRSKAPTKWEAGVCEAKWATFQPKNIGIGSVFHWAEEDSPRISVDTARRTVGRLDMPTPADTAGEEQPKHEENYLPILIRANDLHLIPPAEELVCDLLYVNTLHQIFGAPGGGKSFLALDIAATVAQTRRVVYVAAEAIEDYESRLDAWQIHHKASAGDLYFWREPLTLASEGDVRRFIALADDPALVVIDPLVDCLTGLDESNGRDMGVALYALNTIRRHTRAAVLIVHHTGWVDDHERGHSSLRAACRVVGKVDAREDGLIRLVCEKKNHGKKFDPRSFRLVAMGTMGGALILPARMVMPGKVRLTDKLLKVMEAMTTEPLRGGATHTELLKDTAIPAGTLNRVLTSLADAGYIRAEDSGRSRKYYLTTEGRQALTLSFEEQSESGRTLEDSGSGWNWKVVSSTGLAHNKEVLPNASISLPPTPLSPLKGGKGVAGEFQSSSTGNGYHPPIAVEATVKGYREFGGYGDNAAAPEEELFPDTPAAAVAPPPAISVVAPPVSTFNLEHVRRLLDTQNVAALVTHYRLNRRQDVTGLTTDDIVDLAMQEASAE